MKQPDGVWWLQLERIETRARAFLLRVGEHLRAVEEADRLLPTPRAPVQLSPGEVLRQLESTIDLEDFAPATRAVVASATRDLAAMLAPLRSSPEIVRAYGEWAADAMVGLERRSHAKPEGSTFPLAAKIKSEPAQTAPSS